MKEHLDTFCAQGCEIVVVTPSRPEDLREVLADHPQSYLMVGDPEREAYRAFGLNRGKFSMFFTPKVLGRYFSRMWAGWKIRKPRKGEDLLQLGGDFILDGSRRLIFAHRSIDPADRPTVQQLLATVTRPGPALSTTI